jgi:peptidyl-prolyl cis-trans isomerase SurA
MLRKYLLCVAGVLLLSVCLAADTVVEEIIARVNDSIITRSDFNKSKEQLANEIKQQNVADTDPRAKEKEKDVLRDLIDQQLLLDKGKELGITGDTELVKRLDELRKQMNLESMDDLEKEAEKQGVSFEDFKQGLRNNIITQEVISHEVGPKIQISPQEIQQFYDAHKAEFTQPESIDLSEILVSTGASEVNVDPNAAPPEDPAKVAAAEEKAKQLLASIKAGAKFDEVAKKSSDGPTAAQGGELGTFKRGSMAQELEDLTFKMKPGDVSDVIRTKQGFVILKVNAHTQAGLAPLKKVENRIQEAIYYDKLQPALRTYLTKLREDAYIDIKPGFVDTGASPNQTKLIYTTAADTNTAKKLKKKKKLGIL